MAYGYGLSASLLQMARAYTPLARDGDVIPVSLMRQEQPVTRRARVLAGHGGRDPQDAADGRRARRHGPEGADHRLLGAGGGGGGRPAATASKGDLRDQQIPPWFVGMAPISAPRIIVAVMVDEPRNGLHYGGDVAAPVFSQVVQQTLRMMNVAPDLDVKAHISANRPAEPESF